MRMMDLPTNTPVTVGLVTKNSQPHLTHGQVTKCIISGGMSLRNLFKILFKLEKITWKH